MADLVPLLIPLTFVLMFFSERFFPGRTFATPRGYRLKGFLFFFVAAVVNIGLPVLFVDAVAAHAPIHLGWMGVWAAPIVFLLNPDASLISASSVPLSYQLHALGGWIVIAVWPFTRLVHAWSVPLGYLRRRPIVYRARAPRSVRAGAFDAVPSTEGRSHVQQ